MTIPLQFASLYDRQEAKSSVWYLRIRSSWPLGRFPNVAVETVSSGGPGDEGFSVFQN